MDAPNFKPKKTFNTIVIKKRALTNLLEIPDHHIESNPLPQRISWTLDAALQQGDFTSFAWLAPLAATGTFGPAEISSDGNSLTVSVLNGGGNTTKGNYAYVITLELGGQMYSTQDELGPAAIKDPIIINK